MSRIYIAIGNSRQGRELPARIALIVRVVRTTVSLWRNRMRYRRALARMSERELTDIGVCWSQVVEDVSKPFWRA